MKHERKRWLRRFLNLEVDKSGSMSAMKLQKLVYYSQGWHLVFEGEPMFPSVIEAWANGSVVPALYSAHRGLFTVKSEHFTEASVDRLGELEIQTIDAVLEAYGELTAHQLSNLTHSERPWIEARAGVQEGRRSNVTISQATMQEFYEQSLRETTV